MESDGDQTMGGEDHGQGKSKSRFRHMLFSELFYRNLNREEGREEREVHFGLL